MLTSSRVLVFSDFNCPFCFTLNEWIEALDLGTRVRWVGVEHRPNLPTQGSNRSEDRELMLSEVSEVRRRAPEVPVAPPPLWANSRLALTLQNAIEDDHPERAPALRSALFRSYWSEGEDLASRALLDQLLGANNLPALDAHFLDEPTVDEHTTWWRQELDRIPVMIAPTGARHLGLQDKATVEAFLHSAVFEPEPGAGCR